MDAVPAAAAQRWPGRITERTLAAGPVHGAADTRPLGEPPRAGEMRYDVLTGEWVTIAGHRMNRTFLPSAADCPLDPTRDPARPTEIPDSQYDVAVFANRFPSYAPLTVGPAAD